MGSGSNVLVEETQAESSQDRDADNNSEGKIDLYYEVRKAMHRPNTDPVTENLNWFLRTFEREVVVSKKGPNDVFEAVINQSNLRYVSPEALRTILTEFVVQERKILEPIIADNLNSRGIEYNDFVRYLRGNATNGMELTLLTLSCMLQKTIIAMAEDYVWLTHAQAFEDFDLYFVVFKSGDMSCARKINGDVVTCELPHLANFESASDRQEPYEHSELNRSDFSNGFNPDTHDTHYDWNQSMGKSENTDTPTVQDMSSTELTLDCQIGQNSILNQSNESTGFTFGIESKESVGIDSKEKSEDTDNDDGSNISCSLLKVKSIGEDSIENNESLTEDVQGHLVGGDLSTTVDPNELDTSYIPDEHIENTNKCKETEVDGKLSNEEGPFAKNDTVPDEDLTEVPTPDDHQIHVSDNTGKLEDTESLNTSDHSKDSSNCDSKIDTTTDSIATGKNINLDRPNSVNNKN